MFVRIMGAYVHLAAYICQAKSACPLKIILPRVARDTENGNRKRHPPTLRPADRGPSLVTAGMDVRGGGPGVARGRPGGSPAAVSKHETLENLAFADDWRPAVKKAPVRLISLVGESNYNINARSRGGKFAQYSPFDGDGGGCLPPPGSTEAFRRSHSCQAAARFI